MDTDKPVTGRMNELSDSELAYCARWVAMNSPGVAEEALASLALYKRLYPDMAAMLFRPEVTR